MIHLNSDEDSELTHPAQLACIMDDDDATAREIYEMRRRAANFALRALRLVMQYRGNKELAIRSLAFALEDYEMAGGETAVDIAVLLFRDRKKKAAVSRCINEFQICLGLPKTNGQRKIEGCKKMAEARKGQLQ